MTVTSHIDECKPEIKMIDMLDNDAFHNCNIYVGQINYNEQCNVFVRITMNALYPSLMVQKGLHHVAVITILSQI